MNKSAFIPENQRLTIREKIKAQNLPFKVNIFDTLISSLDSLDTKKEVEEWKKEKRKYFIEHFGVKFKDTIWDFIIGILKQESFNLELKKIHISDISDILEDLPEDERSKIKFALTGVDLLGINLRTKDCSTIITPVINVTPTDRWVPWDISGDSDNILSPNDIVNLSLVIDNLVSKDYPNSYLTTLVGPKGGELELGTLFSKNIKPKGNDKSEVVLASGCKLVY